LLYFFQPIAVNFAQFEFFSEAAMKSVVISVSLFLAALYLAVTISREPMRAQAIIPTRDIAGTISQAKPNILLAEAVDPSLEVTVDQENSSDVVTKIEDTWEKQYEITLGKISPISQRRLTMSPIFWAKSRFKLGKSLPCSM
jgi:hypothetical protein